MMAVQAKMIDEIVPMFGNETVMEQPTYMVYHMNQMLKSMTLMMERVVGETE